MWSWVAKTLLGEVVAMGSLLPCAGQEAASKVYFEGKDLEGPLTVYRVRVFLAPKFEFEGWVFYEGGQWGAVVTVDGREICRREDIWSVQQAKARIDREYHQVYHKFLEWLNLRVFEQR